ncbi:hypothetical protein CPC197_0711A, partial [Chlamydia psittaci C1/97]
MTGTTKRYPSI